MDVRVLADPAGFLAAALPLLVADEARHNLILGIAATMRDQPSLYPERRLWLVRHRGETVGAALRTPPQNLVLARPHDPAALDVLAGALEEDLPGVVGAVPEVEQFADAWSRKTGVAWRPTRGQGIYALERVRPVPGVPGRMRGATRDDRPLLLEWMRAFTAEALHDESPDVERLDRWLDHRLAADGAGLALWEHQGPVSLAGFGGRTPDGIRVGPVYTPPERRGRGYASALVAELSAGLLAGGRRFCFLYTDLANPTSNRIYGRIGYERVCESAEIAFGPG